jgi:DNA-binding CsgD family transcriptional regulator
MKPEYTEADVERVPEAFRALMRLRLSGMRQIEAADALGRSRGAIRKAESTIRRKLGLPSGVSTRAEEVAARRAQIDALIAEGLDAYQIADRVGISVGAAERRMQRLALVDANGDDEDRGPPVVPDSGARCRCGLRMPCNSCLVGREPPTAAGNLGAWLRSGRDYDVEGRERKGA